MSLTPKIISVSELPTQEAKFSNSPQVLEAERIRLLAVAVMALIRSKTNAFPVSTVIIEQFRPPIGKYIIEFPAGLVDEGDTVESAAIRELEEETGFKADRADSVLEVSDLIVSDPGMTNANMKFIIVNVTLEDKLVMPKQKLEAGEFIVPRIVEVYKLHDELKEYAKKGFVVDARLSHFAMGFNLGAQMTNGHV
ncbi:hypothetical protein NP233_g7865 [Leucocoprinus birnbaumii]|uniref:Nudix hydrolase domain-containing protein n=1 Tax=Leucocoprinus birnbaumii TaxID=56174 RepID=A0AAD5VR33_9AGAR|nr:hypothetical protein NP233_g7865 [Leucocoprinus birnbaumii]